MLGGGLTLGPWMLVLIAGILEIVWALGFKYVGRDAPLWQHLIIFTALIASFALLIEALKVLPAGTAYAVWTGIGAVGVAAIGIAVFKEPATLARIACIGLIVAGIIGLKLSTSS